MLSLNVVLAQHDPTAASSLVNNLRGQCRAVTVTRKEQVRDEILRSRASVAVLDLELFSLAEVRQLCHEFKAVSVVCTHRLADEEIWTNVMNAGASDCCLPNDVNGIMFAVRRYAARARTAAA
jgi:DNA-binding response OmpR family regulator